MSSLIGFHRVLIAFAIAFCLLYAGWEIVSWWTGGSTTSLAIGALFVVLAAGFGYYLTQLRRFVGYRDDDPPTP